MGNSELSAQREGRLKEFGESRKTLTAWCRERGLSIHQAKYWQRKLSRNIPVGGKAPQWVTFEISGSSEAAVNRKTTTMSVKVGPAVIEIHPGYNAELLKDVIRTLATIC